MTPTPPRERLHPPRSESERRLRRALLWQLLLPVAVVAVNVPGRLMQGVASPLDVGVLASSAVLVAIVFVELVPRFHSFGSWRALPVEPGETMLWGTVASLILPTGGAGHGGRFALSTTRLRFLPGLASRLRGTGPAEWPVASIVSVEVSPVDGRRRLRGGAWVVIHIADADPVTVLTPEPHLVAAELHENVVRTR